MLLPANFTDIIAETFYDKTVTKLVETETNTNGWIEKTLAPNGTFKANAQFRDLEKFQSEMGLSEQIDIAITCDKDEVIPDYVSYRDVTYRTTVRPFDSHLKIAGKKWQG